MLLLGHFFSMSLAMTVIVNVVVRALRHESCNGCYCQMMLLGQIAMSLAIAVYCECCC